ncbi:hypothetical protein BKA70DRAFT_1427629 [Coprinopsis sp. MPI-PUGE-AT-0042]|nr:hypothetical protein BKA70DRAFT_1427629 [Coprinopsis sp. MPI-PUGE-AT-0042]
MLAEKKKREEKEKEERNRLEAEKRVEEARVAQQERVALEARLAEEGRKAEERRDDERSGAESKLQVGENVQTPIAQGASGERREGDKTGKGGEGDGFGEDKPLETAQKKRLENEGVPLLRYPRNAHPANPHLLCMSCQVKKLEPNELGLPIICVPLGSLDPCNHCRKIRKRCSNHDEAAANRAKEEKKKLRPKAKRVKKELLSEAVLRPTVEEADQTHLEDPAQLMQPVPACPPANPTAALPLPSGQQAQEVVRSQTHEEAPPQDSGFEMAPALEPPRVEQAAVTTLIDKTAPVIDTAPGDEAVAIPEVPFEVTSAAPIETAHVMDGPSAPKEVELLDDSTGAQNNLPAGTSCRSTRLKINSVPPPTTPDPPKSKKGKKPASRLSPGLETLYYHPTSGHLLNGVMTAGPERPLSLVTRDVAELQESSADHSSRLNTLEGEQSGLFAIMKEVRERRGLVKESTFNHLEERHDSLAEMFQGLQEEVKMNQQAAFRYSRVLEDRLKITERMCDIALKELETTKGKVLIHQSKIVHLTAMVTSLGGAIPDDFEVPGEDFDNLLVDFPDSPGPCFTPLRSPTPSCPSTPSKQITSVHATPLPSLSPRTFEAVASPHGHPASSPSLPEATADEGPSIVGAVPESVDPYADPGRRDSRCSDTAAPAPPPIPPISPPHPSSGQDLAAALNAAFVANTGLGLMFARSPSPLTQIANALSEVFAGASSSHAPLSGSPLTPISSEGEGLQEVANQGGQPSRAKRKLGQIDPDSDEEEELPEPKRRRKAHPPACRKSTRKPNCGATRK